MAALEALISPGAIAVIGASPDAAKIRGRLVAALKSGTYGGPIYPVNPAHAEIQGLRAYPSIGDIGQPVDLALIVIPAEHVGDTLEQCADAGVKSAVIFSSGFAESGAAKAERQERIGEIAAARGLLVCGPNSVGFLNRGAGINASFSPSASATGATEATDAGEAAAVKSVAVVSQSGGLGFAVYNRGVRRGIRFSHVVSTGNEAHLGALDFAEHLLQKEEVGAIILMLEQVRGGRRFMEVAEKAANIGKPLIIAKLGRSDAAKRSALSHTGSMTGAEFAHDAVFRHTGVIRGDDQDELLDIAAAFTTCPLPMGRNVGIVAISGGAGVWLADACERHGLKVPELDGAVQKDLRGFIPDFGGVSNPVDITAQALDQGGNIATIERIYASPQIDSLAVNAFMTEASMVAAEKADLARIRAQWKKPLLYYTHSLPDDGALSHLAETGVPCYTTIQGCARALSALADYAEFLGLRAAAEAPAGEIETPALPKGKAVLTECNAAPYLAALGIAMPEARLARTVDEAVAAAELLSGAVALKAQSPQLTHKREAGGVALGISGAWQLRRAYAQVTNLPAEIALDGVLVQKMSPKGIEMIAGITRDETFGPLVMVGFGGTDVEIQSDVAWAPAPFGEARAHALIGSLKAFARLDGGVRARRADIGALAGLLVRLSLFAESNRHRIQELDLNPVVLYEEGEGLMALDALIVTRGENGE
jgi:acyl-CoA synthetase (NDP forming)